MFIVIQLLIYDLDNAISMTRMYAQYVNSHHQLINGSIYAKRMVILAVHQRQGTVAEYQK